MFVIMNMALLHRMVGGFAFQRMNSYGFSASGGDAYGKVY